MTVCEVGLLPGEDALLAPEWVPWSARVSAEEKAQEEQDRAEDEAGETAAAGGPEGSGGAPDGEPASGDRAEDRPVPPQEGEEL